MVKGVGSGQIQGKYGPEVLVKNKVLYPVSKLRYLFFSIFWGLWGDFGCVLGGLRIFWGSQRGSGIMGTFQGKVLAKTTGIYQVSMLRYSCFLISRFQ